MRHLYGLSLFLAVCALPCGCLSTEATDKGWRFGLPDGDVWDREIKELNFKETPLTEVAATLERLANSTGKQQLTIRLADGQGIRHARVTFSANKIPLMKALSVISKAIDCRLRHRDHILELVDEEWLDDG